MNTISSKEKPVETKLNTAFVDFINQKKNKKHHKHETHIQDSERETEQSSNLKITYLNNTNEKPSVAPKVDESHNDGSLKSLLSQMSGRVVNKITEINQPQKEEEQSESESESEEEEKDSDLLSEEDYEEEKYNHFVRPIMQYAQEEESEIEEEEEEETAKEVEEPQSKKERRKVECEVFAENIPLYKNEKETVKFFKGINNKIVKIKVLKNKDDGKCRGKAFIKFFSKEEAESFLKSKLKMDKNVLTLTLVKKFDGEGDKPNKKQNKFNKNEGEKNFNQNQNKNFNTQRNYDTSQNTLNTAFIRNLPETLDEDIVKKNFKKFGKIVNVRLMKTGDGKSKGFGYIDFESAASLTNAVTSQEKVTISDKEIFVEKAKSSFSQAVHDDGKRLGKKKRREY